MLDLLDDDLGASHESQSLDAMPVCLQNARPLGLGARALAGPACRSRLSPAVAPASAAGRAPASNGFCRLKVVAMASKKDKEVMHGSCALPDVLPRRARGAHSGADLRQVGNIPRAS